LKTSATATINLPLHGGHAPAYLVKRMIKLSYAISKAITDEYGGHEFIRRLADPLWFQALGCVLGFDWHSSGVTTVVSGVLKQSLKEDVHSISVAGGKGKKATEAKDDIPKLAERHYNLSSDKIDSLVYASRLAAKVDNAAVQDGYSLYHHVVFFDEHGNWTIVQQGMSCEKKLARRYHWISDDLTTFVREPHAGIISANKVPDTLNMTSIDSAENQKVCVEVTRDYVSNLKSSVRRVTDAISSVEKKNTLDNWMVTDSTICNCHGSDNLSYRNNVARYEMPRRLDWNVFRKVYDIRPKNYEQLISVPGIGPAAVRALSLIGEIIFGTNASWQDPVKFNFAHGGKDGVPYPIARKTYDKSISYLSSAIEGAEIDREERIQALKKLAEYSARVFSHDK
jgi:hypothetical protein